MHFNLGREYAVQGKFEKAVSNYLRALDLFPDYKNALQAIMLVLSKDPESISSIENHFFSQHADSSAAEKGIAELWGRLGLQAMETVSQHEDSSAAEMKIGELWDRLGHQEMERENYDTAIQIFRSASMLGSHKAYFLHSLGVAYFRTGDLENAISFLEEAHQLAPENELIFLHLEQLRGTHKDSNRSQAEPPMRNSPKTGSETARPE